MKEEKRMFYKALYFDLCVKDLKKYYSSTNPNGAYKKIKQYLLKQGFSHAQYSGYHSRYRTTDLMIFDLVRKMNQEFDWLQKCLNHFEVANIGVNYNLMQVFEEDTSEPEILN